MLDQGHAVEQATLARDDSQLPLRLVALAIDPAAIDHHHVFAARACSRR